MAFVLTAGSLLVCAHGGHATPAVVAPRLQIGGQPALAQGPFFVAGCANPPPPAGTGPCVTAEFLIAATRVRSTGLALLTDAAPSLCTPTGTPLTVAALQARVRAS